MFRVKPKGLTGGPKLEIEIQQVRSTAHLGMCVTQQYLGQGD
jgi:hypothetical protein